MPSANLRSPLAAAIIAALSSTSIATAAPPLAALDTARPGQVASIDQDGRIELPQAAVADIYIVGLEAPPATQRLASRADHPEALRQLLASGSPDAEQVLAGIDREHNAFLSAASQQLRREIRPLAEQYRFRRAFNGIAVRLSESEARALRARADVRMVVAMELLELHSDAGPGHVGAHETWASRYQYNNGTITQVGVPTAVPGPHNRGEGVVVGVIDTGLNFNSASFSATDATGYTHTNPLGEGNYLGLCSDGGAPEWDPQCNAKVIGGWDFVEALMPEIIIQDPGASNGPGPEDIHGHGSHVAGTAVGNPTMAQVPGGTARLASGVAPNANLVVYNACYVGGSGDGLCPNVATLASVEQAIADGVVDVLNYSIGGGNDPWNDPVSLAFLEAERLGVFTSASAGNSGPGAGSVSHIQPWTLTVAAATHGRGPFVNLLRVDGSAPVPPALQAMPLSFPPSSVPLTGPIEADLNYDAQDPLLCTTPEPGSAAGEVMMVRRGTCTFVAKIENAQTAGALAVILVNTDDNALNPALDGTTIPVAVLPKSAGDQVAAYHAGADDVSVTLDYPAVPTSATPDRLANFSSRGPATVALPKPDITGPGVNILAAMAGEPDAYGLMSGTSMSAPHLAGAAALLRARNPGWSPSQIKSALMLSAHADVIDSVDGLLATPLEQGSGRARVDDAARSPLLLDVDAEDYLLADPALQGDPSSLNIASFGANRCVGTCSFSRTLDNALDDFGTWAVSLQGLPGSVDRGLNLRPGGRGTIELEVDVSGLEQGRYHHGNVRLNSMLRPRGRFELNMPISVYVDPFELALSADALEVTVSEGGSAELSLGIANAGNDGLEWSLLQGQHEIPVVNQPANTSNGMVSSLYTDVEAGAFVADDITVAETTRFKSLSVDGFLFAYYLDTLDMYAQSLTWSIYEDADGAPAGSPVGGAAPVWSHTTSADGPGVTPASNTMLLDLDAAGVELELGPGRYWLVAYPSFESHTPQGVMVMWFRFLRDVQDGAPGMQLNTDPEFGGDPDAEWAPISDAWFGHAGADMVLTADAQCTPDWLSVSSTGGAVGAGEESVLEMQVSTAGLAPGIHHGRLCVQSNDPAAPLTIVPVTLSVEGARLAAPQGGTARVRNALR